MSHAGLGADAIVAGHLPAGRRTGAPSLVAFTSTEVSPGVFGVTPSAGLAQGEHAFMVTPDSDSDDGAAPRFFDFGVAN